MGLIEVKCVGSTRPGTLVRPGWREVRGGRTTWVGTPGRPNGVCGVLVVRN